MRRKVLEMQQLGKEIATAVEDWPVPGLACAVISGETTVLSRGFGVRRVGEASPVDERTLFAIGSVSKSFTGAAVAMLVDSGEISWDSLVADRLPDFRLFDPYVTRELTVRDLLTHRSGLERGDFMWYKSGYESSEVMRRIRHLSPSWSFRSAFGYQNIMFLAAGELIRAVTGESWDEFVEERIFAPLGMHDTRSSIASVDRAGNLASSHAELDGKTLPIAAHEGVNANPAGSIYSNARDMAAWLLFQLGDGICAGRRILTSGSLAATQTPQMPIAYASPWSEAFPDADFLSYGAGWFVWRYRGRKVVSHGGNIDGMTAAACVVPEEGFGICVLCNIDGSMLPQAIVYRALDEHVGNGSRSWLQTFQTMQRAAKERLEFARAERERERLTGTAPSRPLADYAGRYDDPFYGRATVICANDELSIDFIGWRGRLEHWQLDTFRLHADDPILEKYAPEIRFDLDDFGKPAKVTLTLLSSLRLTARRISETPPASPLSPEELKLYEGAYDSDVSPMRVSFEILGNALKAVLPGALAGSIEQYTVVALEPVGGGRFAVPGKPLAVAFEMAGGLPQRVRIEIPHQQPFVFLHAR